MRAVRTAVGLAKLNFTLQSRHLRAAQWPEDMSKLSKKYKRDTNNSLKDPGSEGFSGAMIVQMQCTCSCAAISACQSHSKDCSASSGAGTTVRRSNTHEDRRSDTSRGSGQQGDHKRSICGGRNRLDVLSNATKPTIEISANSISPWRHTANSSLGL